jgi:hypothetical protein
LLGNGLQAPDNHGVLSVTVWPTFVGLAKAEGVAAHLNGSAQVHLCEPTEDFNYDRGQIRWETQPDGSIVGHGRVFIPADVEFTHYIFALHPKQGMCGVTALEHPIRFDRPGFVDVSPIRNQEVLPRA